MVLQELQTQAVVEEQDLTEVVEILLEVTAVAELL
jgi:hypothetical protein